MSVISGVRIGSWYSEVPPIKEGAGKLVEHYQQDFEEDPTDKWAAYWYGQAKHMAGDTEEAIELYMTSIDNGMDEHVPAFFLGDCHDRQGDAKEAIRWYKIAADSKLEDITQMHNRTSSQNYSNSCHWAASRLAWLKHSSPDDSIRSAIEGGEFCKTGSEDKHLWVNQLFTGMEYAKAGDFDKANRTGKSLASKCSPKDKKVLNTVLDAWKAGDEYRWGAEDVPLYLELDDPIPFFRCFEDYLDPSWKGVY